MIVFDLCCDKNHAFEGWFQSADDYERQQAEGLLACPLCASLAVRRVPSAVHVAAAREVAPKPPAAAKNETTPAIHPSSGLRAAYHQFLSFLKENSEDVGRDFVHEARRMHALQTPQRSIHGEATTEDFEALREEGIDVLRLPAIKKEDLS